MLLFTFGINGEDTAPLVCTSIAALLHFVLLSAFLWMLADTWLQYQIFVHVFRAHRAESKLEYRTVLTYGAALATSAISFGAFADDYSFGFGLNATDAGTAAIPICWIAPHSTARYMFFVSFAVVLAANLVLFTAVMHVMLSAPAPRRSARKMVPPHAARALKASLVFAPSMGFGWGLGIAGAEATDVDVRLGFTYVFTAVVATQGIFLCWHHLFKDPEVRIVLRKSDWFAWLVSTERKKGTPTLVVRRRDALWKTPTTLSTSSPRTSSPSDPAAPSGASSSPPDHELPLYRLPPAFLDGDALRHNQAPPAPPRPSIEPPAGNGRRDTVIAHTPCQQPPVTEPLSRETLVANGCRATVFEPPVLGGQE